MKPLDDKDRLLLSLLKKNARTSLVTLAKRINLSRSATHDRIVRLEENQVIQSYTITLDNNAEQPTKAIFMIHFNSGQQNDQLAKEIASYPNITSAHCLSGEVDLMVHVACENATQLAELRQAIADLAGIESVRTYSVLNSHQ